MNKKITIDKSADYTIIPLDRLYDPRKSEQSYLYKIIFQDGTRGDVALVNMNSNVVSEPMMAMFKTNLISSNYNSDPKLMALDSNLAPEGLNVYNLNFYPFGSGKTKFEGNGLGSKIYDDLNLEKIVNCPAVIFAKVEEISEYNENRMIHLLIKKGYNLIEQKKDNALFYKLIVNH
jgi:hypothetical protein